MTAPTTQTTHELRIDPSKPLGDEPGTGNRQLTANEPHTSWT